EDDSSHLRSEDGRIKPDVIGSHGMPDQNVWCRNARLAEQLMKLLSKEDTCTRPRTGFAIAHARAIIRTNAYGAPNLWLDIFPGQKGVPKSRVEDYCRRSLPYAIDVQLVTTNVNKLSRHRMGLAFVSKREDLIQTPKDDRCCKHRDTPANSKPYVS